MVPFAEQAIPGGRCRVEATRVVRVSGTPGERGQQHGQALAEPIERLYDNWMRRASEGKEPILERDIVSYALSHLPESRAYAPDLVEEAEAIAAGARVPFEKIWFLNCFDEAGNYRQYR